MKKTMTVIIVSALAATAGNALADSHADDDASTSMVELFTCNYNEDKSYSDLMGVVEDWNDWADDEDISDYSAWTMLPYYTGPNQDFEIAWMGGAQSAAALGRSQDTWLATGSSVAERFEDVISCANHSAFSVMTFREPPERENRDRLIITFTDCDLAEGTSFNDLSPSIQEWADYKGENGSTAGMWVFMPSMGGGGEDFSFKWVNAYQNLEDLGSDRDQSSQEGWKKGQELFAGKVTCDSSRAYVLNNHRRAESND